MREHLAATGSTRARTVLDPWENYRDLFRKAVPCTAPVGAEEEAAAV